MQAHGNSTSSDKVCSHVTRAWHLSHIVWPSETEIELCKHSYLLFILFGRRPDIMAPTSRLVMDDGVMTSTYRNRLQDILSFWRRLSKYASKSKACDTQAVQSITCFRVQGSKVVSLTLLSRRLSSWISSILGARRSTRLLPHLSPFLQPTGPSALAKAG